jgi:serine/threonine protein kinase/Tfp pilus assembly protein PilF
MSERWRQGECPLAEEFLSAHPQFENDPEAIIALIDEEVFLRRERGQQLGVADYLLRFPRWRTQIEVLFNCHQILESNAAAPRFPDAGEVWGDFRLLAELGRGALGRVFLATQPTLADRAVVLKFTPRRGQEHLSLARLQHTNIVPLFSVVEDPERDLKALCMPYFGGASLADLLSALPPRSPTQLMGRDLLSVLDKIQARAPVQLPPADPARQFLSRATFVQAICWIGACLAEALKYAHQRGVVHLDLKPSNVLLAADGQPMLMDFHLAHEPIAPGGPRPRYLGGSPHYMSPEQKEALAALRDDRPVPSAVDGRSDIYSLGLILAEALAGPVPANAPPIPSPEPRGIPKSLGDLIHKCLAAQAENRYPDAGFLAADLWRHLNDQPLKGVANRSLTERWQKWRRRRPHLLALLSMALAALVVVAGAGAFVADAIRHNVQIASAAIPEAQKLIQEKRYSDAIQLLSHGLGFAARVPGYQDLKADLANLIDVARRAEAVEQLHSVANQFRLVYGIDEPPARRQRILAPCRKIWDDRKFVLEALGSETSAEASRIRADFLDLAILMADLQVALAREDQRSTERRQAIGLLDQAEALFGPSPVLDHERQRYAAGAAVSAAASKKAGRTAWEHYALGRSYLNSGQLDSAVAHFERALALEPDGLWPNFYYGLCAFRLGRLDRAAVAFSVCIGKTPVSGCYYHRALAYAELKQTDLAVRDYDQAIKLGERLPSEDPNREVLKHALLNRGILHYRWGEYDQAVADLHRALNERANAAVVHYNLAHVYLAKKDRAAALVSLEQSLACDPTYRDAREMYERLSGKQQSPRPPGSRPSGDGPGGIQ